MTRARHALHLIAPVKFYVTQQTRYGDAHVFGTRSRFITPRVMESVDSFCTRHRDLPARTASLQAQAMDGARFSAGTPFALRSDCA
jgi:hypothetical protein